MRVLLLVLLVVSTAVSEEATGVFIPSSLSYLLPQPYQGYEILPSYLSNTSFVNTVTNDPATNNILETAKNSTYYAFDNEFYTILGSATPELTLVETRSSLFAYEAGAWDYDKNQVWFSSCLFASTTYISVLDLASNTITTLDIPALQGLNPNGGYYYNGTMYFTAAGNLSLPTGNPAIYAIDTSTYTATVVLNSFYGLPYQSIDDLAWVRPNYNTSTCTTSGPSLFFSTLDLTPFGATGITPLQLQDGVYRYSPDTQSVQGVISRSDIVNPNGVRGDATGKYLYVTGTAAPFSSSSSGEANPFLSAVVYRFTLDEDCEPTKKRLVALVRSYADGLHIDDFGRIWTGEPEGITVRSPSGKVLGIFNAETLVGVPTPPLANFALAGDKLVVLGLDRVWVLQLGQNVTSRAMGTQ